MLVPAKEPACIRFGPFEVDLQSRELRRDGQKASLQDKPFQVLALLLERPHELVTRDEFRQKLWPADTFVDFEHGINTAVRKLRETLGDDAEQPCYIETLPKRGYRFLCDVEETAPATPQAVAENDSSPSIRWRLISATVGAVALLG